MESADQLPNSYHTPRRQLHFWISCRDHQFLCDLADEEQDTIASILRRVIRTMRTKHDVHVGERPNRR